MNREELQQILPHRGAMLLLDEAVREGGEARGSFLVRDGAWFLQGHFPGDPVVPGVMLCEILAQSVCVLLQDRMKEGTTPMYTGLNNVRFRAPVRPGDLFETRCRITKERAPFFFASGEGFVRGRLCVKAEFSFALTER